ncbi:MAG: YkgJ family cysteine cluster protein, partial [Candidatus Helarchaeota archaeon]|nr:YkgJ family cysteine cluster protein [Candidatus Helarchaeota archaeon]
TSDADRSLEEKLMTPAIITNHGKIFLGLQRINDRCVFLEEKSCQIYDVRPLICHSFPYTFQVRDNQIYWGYSLKAKEFCPAIIGKSKINKKHLEHLASIILKEFEEFKQLIHIWNTLAQNNLINPTPQMLLSFLTGKIKLTVENLGSMT